MALLSPQLSVDTLALQSSSSVRATSHFIDVSSRSCKELDKAITDQVEVAYKEHGVTLALDEKVMSLRTMAILSPLPICLILQITQFWALASASYRLLNGQLICRPDYQG